MDNFLKKKGKTSVRICTRANSIKLRLRISHGESNVAANHPKLTFISTRTGSIHRQFESQFQVKKRNVILTKSNGNLQVKMIHTSAFLLKFIDFSVEALQRFCMFLLHKKDRTFCILELYASLSQSSSHSEYHPAIASDENAEINIKIPTSVDHIFNMAASPLPPAAECKYFAKKPWQTGFVTISSLRHHFPINEHFSLACLGRPSKSNHLSSSTVKFRK